MASARSRKYGPVTAVESEAMFRLWCELRSGKGIQGVATAFGRSRTTVTRIAKTSDWEQRYQTQILAGLQRTNNNVIVGRQNEKLEMAAALERAAFEGLYKREVDPATGEVVSTLKRQPTVSDAIRASRYQTELEEKLGIDTEVEMTPVPQTLLHQAARVISLMTDKQIRAIGDWIVRHCESPEDILKGRLMDGMCHSGFEGE